MDALIPVWHAARTEWAAAVAAGEPLPMRNRLMDRIWTLGREIAAHAELQETITELCGADQDPYLRVDAALVREHWDVAGAADTLVSVIHDSGASIARPVTMSVALEVRSTAAARTAALCLLNIDDGRGNTGTGA